MSHFIIIVLRSNRIVFATVFVPLTESLLKFFPVQPHSVRYTEIYLLDVGSFVLEMHVIGVTRDIYK